MNIHFVLFISSIMETNKYESMIKTVQSEIRPVVGDIIDDPGFDPAFHNGYEVVKVTLNYAKNECWVSLSPLAIEMEKIKLEAYVEKLEANGWRIISKQ